MSFAARVVALQMASRLHRPRAGQHEQWDALARHVLRTAEHFERWLDRPAHLAVTHGPVRDQTTGQPTGTTTEGNPMQIHDTEQFTLTVEPTDAKGQPVGDTLEWSIDDADVATLTVSDDTLTCTVAAGVVGSAIITVTDGTLSATEALDVIAGAVAAITVTEGPVSEQ